MKIENTPIGLVHSPFKKLNDMPNQSFLAKGIRGTVEVYPDFKNGLQVDARIHMSMRRNIRL